MRKATWLEYTTYLPLWVSVFRWGMFTIFRLVPVLFYRLKHEPKRKERGDNVEQGNEQPFTREDVTAIIPVYQPPPSFIKTIDSLAKNGVPKILVVADITCVENVTELVKDYPQVEIIPETKPGKRSAMATGLKEVRTRLTFFVDDDIQWCDTALDYLLHPFNHNSNIKGVGCEHTARKKHAFDIEMILCDMRLSVRMLELFSTSVIDKGASCISGRTACYVTNFIQEEEFYEQFLNEKFFGMQVVSGDDKFLTRYVMRKGGKIWHQGGKKCVLSTTFERGPRFMKQLLRWSRNTWRSDITCLFIERAVWRNNPFTALVMLDKVVTPFFLIYGLFFIPISAIVKQDYVMFIGWLIWLVFSRILRLSYYFVKNPLHMILIPFFIIFQYIQAIVRVWALFTLYERGWGTRNITLNGNTIERDDIEVVALEQQPQQSEPSQQSQPLPQPEAQEDQQSYQHISFDNARLDDEIKNENVVEDTRTTEEKQQDFYKKKLESL
jgi:cellulose synthase/poly-beta-1,6-N-acetylglucosamine synthase-like glycosyltransferase